MEKVTRVTISPALPPMRAREFTKYSPITPDERRRVEAAIGRLDPDTMTPERWQRLADVIRRPLERVDRAALSGYLEVGRWLVRVNDKAPHGTWTCLFRGSPNAIEMPLPLTVKKAQALMRFAKDEVLGNPRNWSRLPVDSWRTMDELTRLGKSQDLQRLINHGRVHAHTSVREVLALARGGDGPFADATGARAQVPAAADAPLQELRRARHFYAGPLDVLAAFLRDWLADVEAQMAESPEGDLDEDEED